MKQFDLDQLKKMLAFADTLEAAGELEQAEELRGMADIEVMRLSQVIELESMVQGIIDKVQASDPTAVAIKPIADFLGLERADTTDQ